MKNKKVKVTEYWRKGSRSIYTHLTKWQLFVKRVKTFFKVLFWGIIIASILIGIYYLGAYTNPKTIYTKAEVIKEVPIKAPVLERIADCESGKRLPNGKAIRGSASHYAPSGQVLMTGNNNKSVDVGKYAINSVWFKKATELGLDITKEEDNKKMAQWIYENRGTEDWYPSKSCWSK